MQEATAKVASVAPDLTPLPALKAISFTYSINVPTAPAPVPVESAPELTAEQQDWQAFMSARFGELEKRVAALSAESAGPEIADDLPAVEPMPAWTGAKAFHTQNDAAKDDQAERVRSKRLRIVRRYLAMRKERTRLRANMELLKVQQANARNSATEFMRNCDVINGERRSERRKRKASTLLARDLQKRVNYWHDEARSARDISGELVTERDAERNRATRAEAALIHIYTQAEILGRSLREATERAKQAETALAATAARLNGWPPAVARVTYKRAA
jgi:hypothetical protein